MKILVTAGPRKGRMLDWPERQARALVKANRAEHLDDEPEPEASVDAGQSVVPHGAEPVAPAAGTGGRRRRKTGG